MSWCTPIPRWIISPEFRLTTRLSACTTTTRRWLSSGRGAWEVPESTFRLRDICAQKDIHVWFDIWGYDVKHDWDWWYQQVAYHVPHIL